jgi:FAD:protein FMN transferase
MVLEKWFMYLMSSMLENRLNIPSLPSVGERWAKGDTYSQIHYLMGTFVEIEVSGETLERAKEAVAQAFSEIRRIERVFSKYLPTSPVSQLNRCAGLEPVEIPFEVKQLIENVKSMSEEVDGSFDLTVNVLMELWSSAEKKEAVPANSEIQNALKHVGMKLLVLSEEPDRIFFKKPGVQLDFGGVGKGYAIDRAIQVLRSQGIKEGLINAGGNIYCMGGEGPSQIGIRDPLAPDDLIATVVLKDRAVATSASYERFFDFGGLRYSHIIDPRSGYPIQNEVLSVSILSQSACQADLVSTAVSVLGLEQGMALIEQRNGIEGVVIVKDSAGCQTYESSGLTESSCQFFERRR